jgi:hypothetical protein
MMEPSLRRLECLCQPCVGFRRAEVAVHLLVDGPELGRVLHRLLVAARLIEEIVEATLGLDPIG